MAPRAALLLLLPLLAAGVSLERFDPDGMVPHCTRAQLLHGRRCLRFVCSNFRLGNALMLYWNARASALFSGSDFEMAVQRQDFLARLPQKVAAAAGSGGDPVPGELRGRLWAEMKGHKEACWRCPFPHGKDYGPWRLIGDTIFNETQAAVQRTIAEAPAKTQQLLDWSKRQSWAALHFRCDETLWLNEQYGFPRFAFLREHLPKNSTHLLVVGQVHSKDGLCRNILSELQSWAGEQGLQVALQEATALEDWLTLATAPLLLCSPSTYCLTAALGNGNEVFFPVNGESMAVRTDGPDIAGAAALRSPRFHWVPTDYVPGPAAIELPWPQLKAYLRADGCAGEAAGCVAVGGAVPEKYRFHAGK